MNLKPYRDYDEHDVLNGFFSLDAPTGSKGTFVVATTFNPDSWQGFANSWARGINGVFSSRSATTAKVTAASSGELHPLGMMIYDVKEVDENGFPLAIMSEEKQRARQCVISGQPVPLATKGVWSIAGYEGVANCMSGAQIANGGAGALKVVGKDVTPRVGTFLSPSGADGYAFFKLEL